ncbi:MAG: T9SS type A sorting domain-containing protein [Ignavibacteria bacterium]|nr:T9SS type A sorting domain-containing protein [Ignavibacteria bacterium]
MKKILLFILFVIASQVAVAQWVPLGDNFKWGVTCMAKSHNSIFTGNSIDLGVSLSKDNGVTWEIRNVIYGDGVSALIVFDNEVFAFVKNGVFSTADTAKTWVMKSNSNSIGGVNYVLPVGSYIFAASNYGVFVSKDTCKSWVLKNSGLKNLTVLSMDYRNGSLIVGTKNGIYLSKDMGENWVEKNSGLTNLTVRAIAYKGDTILAGTENRLFISTDRAETWADPLIGFSPISSIKTRGDTVVLGFQGGIFLSIDGGKFWTVMNNGLESVNIKSIFMYNDDIYIGAGNRLYYSNLKRLIATVVEELPASSSSSLRISPQPINGDYLTISNIPASASDLRIYSLLGEIVHSEVLNGAERRQINVSGLPAGVYYLQVGMETRMVIKQ